MLELNISRINFRGEGLGVAPDGACFRVANVLSGELITAFEAASPRKKLALLADVITPAPEAVVPDCPHWRLCAACQFMRMAPVAQEQLKKQQWLRVIGRFVDLEPLGDIPMVSPQRWLGYRHKTHAHFEAGHFVMPARADVCNLLERIDNGSPAACAAAPGFNARKFVNLVGCRLHADCLNAVMAQLEPIFSELKAPEVGVEYEIEAFENNARITIQAPPATVDEARRFAQTLAAQTANTGVRTAVILQPLPPRGSHVFPPTESFAETPYYNYTRDVEGNALEALKGAWTPVNPINACAVRDVLSHIIQSIGHRFDSVVELGCGCGTHARLFASWTASYRGIDASWPAILSAQHNAECYHWDHTAFQTATALHYLEKNYYKGHRADLILMHSNRLPYQKEVAIYCKKFNAQSVMIVAPTAYALAAECQHFVEIGYHLKALILCDTMPYTYHMMAVAHLSLA